MSVLQASSYVRPCESIYDLEVKCRIADGRRYYLEHLRVAGQIVCGCNHDPVPDSPVDGAVHGKLRNADIDITT